MQMSPEKLAETVLTMVKVYGLSEQGKVEFLSAVTTQLFDNMGLVVPSVPVQTLPTPPPPAPTQPEPGGAVWILKGGSCTCKVCHKLVYKVTKDVHERVKAEELFASFEPLNGANAMTEGVNIFGDAYGNLAVDCPLCKGVKSVWIRGDGEYESIPEDAG